MRLFTMTIAALVFLGMTGLVLANPSMLPKHGIRLVASLRTIRDRSDL